MSNTNRRSVLRGVLGAGTLAVAGCTDSASPNNDESDGGDDADGAENEADADAAFEAAVEGAIHDRWLPSTVASPEEGTSFVAIDYATVRAASEALPESTAADLRTEFETYESVGLQYDQVDAGLGFGSSLILTGSFDANTVTSTLETNGSEVDHEYEGAALYDAITIGTFEDAAVAVGPGVVVATEDAPSSDGGDGRLDYAERIVDAGLGNDDRLQDVDDDVNALVEAVDSPTLLVCETYGPSETGDENSPVGSVIAWTIDPEASTAQLSLLYESEDAVDSEQFESTVVESGQFEHYGEPSFASNGRVVTARATKPTDEFNFFDPPGAERDPAYPQVGLSSSHDADAGEWTVTISSIETPLERVTIRRNDDPVAVFDDPVVGASQTIAVSAGDRVVVTAETEAGIEGVVLTREF